MPKEKMSVEQAKELLLRYKEYEDENYHSEAAKLLTDNFGTSAQRKKMDGILDTARKKFEGISDKDYKWRYKNTQPYYQALVKVSKSGKKFRR